MILRVQIWTNRISDLSRLDKICPENFPLKAANFLISRILSSIKKRSKFLRVRVESNESAFLSAAWITFQYHSLEKGGIFGGVRAHIVAKGGIEGRSVFTSPLFLRLKIARGEDEERQRDIGAPSGIYLREREWAIRFSPPADPHPTLIISRYPARRRSGFIEFAITWLLANVSFPFLISLMEHSLVGLNSPFFFTLSLSL